MAKTIGKVQDLAAEFNFEWRIDDFLTLEEKVDTYYNSPTFSFAGESWYISIYPNGLSRFDAVGYIGLYLHKNSFDSTINLKRSFALKTFEGNKDHEYQCSVVFEKGNAVGRGTSKFIKRSTLLEKKSKLLPSDALTIILSVTNCSRSNKEADSIETTPCSYCKEILDAECISSHEETCLDRPITCRMCKVAVPLKSLPEHECETTTVKEELANDLTNILESEEFSDFTVKVKDQEFRLHRSILAARNPYFRAMFQAEMIENKTSTMTIDDCEPDIFRSFVHFIYTGKLQALSHNNVCALYKVADKYQQDQLKAECLFFMKNEISVDSFCDFIELALMHDKEELFKNATEFYCKNVKGIIKSVKWQNFLREYPTQANELSIKAFDYYVK